MAVKEKNITDVRVDVPEDMYGDWKVEKFTVEEDAAKLHNIRATFSFGGGGRTIEPGEYTRLVRNGTIVMSDTPAEIRDHLEFVRRARQGGHILINGLGLGWALEAILDAPKIETITVVEKSYEVVSLIAKHYEDKCPSDKKLWIIQDDALTYKAPKGKRYNAVWHDIWDYICADNLDDMKTLHRKYGRRCDWQGSWCRYQCEQANRRY